MTPGFLLKSFFSLVARRELRFQFDRAPLVARNIPAKKLGNLFLTGINRVLPVSRALGYPYMAHVSPSGICDLRCAVCPAHDPLAKGKALLPFDTYRRLIDEIGDYLVYVILWSWGEPFLNPDLGRMIAYARERNILTVTSTNLNRFSAGRADRGRGGGAGPSDHRPRRNDRRHPCPVPARRERRAGHQKTPVSSSRRDGNKGGTSPSST